MSRRHRDTAEAAAVGAPGVRTDVAHHSEQISLVQTAVGPDGTRHVPVITPFDPARARTTEVPSAARPGDRDRVNAVERASESAAYYIDVVDRVLDKGIVIEAGMRISVGGIDLLTVDARVIVASVDTHLRTWPPWTGRRRWRNDD